MAVDMVERRKYYLSSGDNEVETYGRDEEIEYKNFLLEFILSGESINDLGEDLFDFKSSEEEERIIREKAAFLFKNITDPEKLKAILDLVESVFNFVAISDAAPRVEKAIEEKTKRDGTEDARNQRSLHVVEREKYIRKLLSSYKAEDAKRLTAKKIAYDLGKFLADKGVKPAFSISPKEVGKSLQKIKKDR